MAVQEALAALGVRDDTLSLEERKKLDDNGFLPLPGILSDEQVRAIASKLDELSDLEGSEAGKEVHQEAGTNRLSDLVNKDPIFEVCFTHPRVLAAIAHVLSGDLKLSSLNSRAALPGQGLQALHADWHEAARPGEYQVCNSIWLIDDFTELNGATRVVPGSHRWGRLPGTPPPHFEEREMSKIPAKSGRRGLGGEDSRSPLTRFADSPTSPTKGELIPISAVPHPDEIQLIAKAGTVVIFNSHVWHGGTLNRTDKPRRALHSYFCRRCHPQQLDQRRYMRPETLGRLSCAARHILDV
jgi:ectoine hydroxylase-related dioxygenase (phytanoyl-CoA dioxygenase family)